MPTIFLLFKKVFLSTFERWRWESIPIIYPFLLCFICGTLKMALISTSCPISILVQLFSLLVYISFICGTLKMALIPIFCPISILVRLFSLFVYISFIAAIWRWRWFQFSFYLCFSSIIFSFYLYILCKIYAFKKIIWLILLSPLPNLLIKDLNLFEQK